MKNMKQLLALVLALVLALGCAAMAEESPFPFTLTTYMDMEVTFEREKYTAQATASVCASRGWLSDAKGLTVDGYEIHAGQNRLGGSAVPWLAIGERIDGVMNESGNVLGSYLHGLFDDGQLFAVIAAHLRRKKGLAGTDAAPVNLEAFREREFDRIASIVRASVDMDAIYRILRGEA